MIPSVIPRRRRAGLFLIASLLLCTRTPAQDAPEDSASQSAHRPRMEQRNFDPETARERMLNDLRQQFDVTDDAEWALIAGRIAKVSALRQGAFGHSLSAAMTLAGRTDDGAGANRRSRAGRVAVGPETTALIEALHRNADDDEITPLLDRVRAARKLQEAQLARAQDELRSVLSVRQEAAAVVVGLLP